MSEQRRFKVAIVDHGLGNLYSVKHACLHVGLDAAITSSRAEIEQASAVILPGVGAFGDAMATLRRLDLVGPLRDMVGTSRPLVGICLGVQLLMSESFEFGRHTGLGIFEGTVVRFDHPKEGEHVLKVPQIGWNRIHLTRPGAWEGTLLDGLADDDYMYFVHSYIVQPQDPNMIVSISHYGHIEFCSSVNYKNVFACQFHPERSGERGLHVYHNLARRLRALDQGETS